MCYSEDYLKSLSATPNSLAIGEEKEEIRVKGRQRINIKEYRYSDGTTSIVINDNEEYEGLDHNDIIQIVLEELRKRKDGRD